MKIYKMTATFGKLSHETLTLAPGLNIIQAPNEWGKSTWCAFLVAMLYGINTREQTKTGFLADKEHYSPWSGEPMSGRIDLCWQGRDITIERRSKGRGYFNDFKAYETHSGLDVPELTASSCGQMLLGVEQSVFTRAGLLRQTDMPVTEDEKLRSRLNALVTTGDDSGTPEILAQKLKELKNRCRFNKTGLIPQTRAQLEQLEADLDRMQTLKTQVDQLQKRLEERQTHRKALENHLQTLAYRENESNLQKLAQARQELAQAQDAVNTYARELPQSEEETRDLAALRALRNRQDGLYMQARLMPPAPQPPQTPEAFRGIDPVLAVEQAKVSARVYAEDSARKYTAKNILAVLAALIGGVLLVVDQPAVKLIGVVLVLAAVLCIAAVNADKKRRQRTMQDLRRSYPGIAPEMWVSAAQQYAQSQAQFDRELASHREKLDTLNRELRQIDDEMARITCGCPVSQWEEQMRLAQDRREDFQQAQKELEQARERVKILESTCRQVEKPALPDELRLTEGETRQALTEWSAQQEYLLRQLGQAQGQMDALGQEETLQAHLGQTRHRLIQLEKIYEAADFALQVQQQAQRELQRRFAPQISQRAGTYMQTLTAGKYDRLVLDQQLQLLAAARGEDTLRSNLWRSSGTADQLYFALRLAVAEELTPDAPLILDDALVRFDDARMGLALELLQQQSQHRQIIVFTCQSREKAWQSSNREENL